jgi:PTH2 family peptidyl-tRNA hydrolase
METKLRQTIVLRHDLSMRKGKFAAQACHASGMYYVMNVLNHKTITDLQLRWILSGQTKIVLRVDSEQELLEIYTKAFDANLEVHLVTDAGHTEFHGVPTKTCLAIGPDEAEKIDKITGHLKLF